MTEDDIHYIYEEYYDSNSDKQDNPVYTIIRGNLLNDLSLSFWNKYLRHKKVQLVGLL